MTSTSSKPVALAPVPAADRLPRHVAVIMDGNGRWAQQRNQPRFVGHQHGVLATRSLIREAARLGIGALTLYSFSLENWKRPAAEVEFLMALCCAHLESELPELLDGNIRLIHVGRRAELPAPLLAKLDAAVDATASNTGTTVALAWNYGSRLEITDAVRHIARRVAAGELAPDQIDERTITNHLYTAGLPDPDLLIRTAGEMRVSNFLLWQISYAELWVTPTLWPDFTPELLQQALADYAARHRRFGGV